MAGQTDRFPRVERLNIGIESQKWSGLCKRLIDSNNGKRAGVAVMPNSFQTHILVSCSGGAGGRLLCNLPKEKLTGQSGQTWACYNRPGTEETRELLEDAVQARMRWINSEDQGI